MPCICIKFYHVFVLSIQSIFCLFVYQSGGKILRDFCLIDWLILGLRPGLIWPLLALHSSSLTLNSRSVCYTSQTLRLHMCPKYKFTIFKYIERALWKEKGKIIQETLFRFVFIDWVRKNVKLLKNMEKRTKRILSLWL